MFPSSIVLYFRKTLDERGDHHIKFGDLTRNPYTLDTKAYVACSVCKEHSIVTLDPRSIPVLDSLADFVIGFADGHIHHRRPLVIPLPSLKERFKVQKFKAPDTNIGRKFKY